MESTGSVLSSTTGEGARRRKIIAGIYAIIGAAVVMAIWMMLAIQSPQRGWDFPVFYIAAHLPIHSLYDRDAFALFWHRELAPIGVPHWAPYLRPSLFALLLRPIGFLPYGQAVWLWFSMGLSAYFACVALLLHRFRLPGFLLPAYTAFFPAIVGLISGQDNSLYVLVLTITLILLERKRDGLAACVLAVCLCKFNLILLIPVMLVLHKRYRALLLFTIAAIGVFLTSCALTPLSEYVIAITEAQQKTPGFFPVGLRGFSIAIGQPWCYSVLAIIVFALCCWLMKQLALSQAFCVAIVGTLLISPYITWYDSTLLALPLALVYARGGSVVRIGCLAILAAIPLWEHGGGNNGPIGFMHVGVELLLLAYFVRVAFTDRCHASAGVT